MKHSKGGLLRLDRHLCQLLSGQRIIEALSLYARLRKCRPLLRWRFKQSSEGAGEVEQTAFGGSAFAWSNKWVV